MHYRRIQSMGKGDNLGERGHESRPLLPATCKTRFLAEADQPREGAVADELVFETRRVDAQVGIKQRNNTGMTTLTHHLVQHHRLVLQQPITRARVETKLERDRRDAVEEKV